MENQSSFKMRKISQTNDINSVEVDNLNINEKKNKKDSTKKSSKKAENFMDK